MPESPNPWRQSNNKWDWPKIRQAYLAGQWPDFESCAQACGIRPSSQLRKVAGSMGEDWNAQKAALERRAEEQARQRILGRLTREFEKRLSGMLDTADVLRYKALQTLGDDKVRLTGHEAIRAAATATDIEREIFLRRGRPIGNGNDDEGPSGQGAGGAPPLPGNPGLLPAPTSLSEINDAHLVRIIEHKPADEHLGGRLEEAKDRVHPGGGGSRGPTKKGRKV